MRGVIRIGGAGFALVLLPIPAYAFDAQAAVVLAPAVFLLIAVAIAGIVLLHLTRELARLEAARAESVAALGSVPAALYLLHPNGAASFAPNGLEALGGIADWAGLRAALAPESRKALDEAVARLGSTGAGFAIELRFAAAATMLDALGRRLLGDSGAAIADAVWLTDAGPRTVALAERDLARAVIDGLALPAWRRAANLALIDCNRAYAAAVDAPPASVLAEGREIAPGIRDLAAAARSSQSAQTASRHVVVAGSRRLMEITESPLGETGQLIGWANDATDRENAEAELVRHIGAHAAVLENTMVAIAIYGPDTRLSFFNTAFARLWQIEPDWLAAEPLLDDVLELLREKRRLPEYIDFRSFKRQQRAMFTSLIEPQEELLHLPDERTLRLLVSPHPFGGLTFAYEDVTDKLALERSYNTLIEVQRASLNNLYEALAVYGSDGRLKLWNPAYAQIWHLDAEDLAGEPHISEIIEKTRPFFDAGHNWSELKPRILARLTTHGAASTRLERLDGSMLQALTVPLPDGNLLLSYLDVTDSSRVEQALRERNEALETADRLKSEFIANVSYELRTPLNAIIGFAEILGNQYFGPLNARQLEHSRNIIESSNQLMALINNILDLATVEAGYLQLDPDEVDLVALLESVLVLTRERARNQGLTLEFDAPPDLGRIVADERRLKQALFNLVSNAVKFTPAGGTVTLAGRRSGHRVELIVADTGVGVAREDQARIFEKFERANPPARQAGVGLGLALVKSFIELHGGRVEMESAPGHGTTVTCILDLAVLDEALPLRSAGQ